MTGFGDVIQSIGAIQRFDEAIKAEKEGRWAGKQYGNIPVLGGLLHPLATSANALGLGLEAAGTTGKAIAGEAAIPFVAGEARFGAGSTQDQQRSQDLMAGGLGALASHPGRTIDSLRHSDNSVTSVLAGILEMVSDPTNVALGPASGFTKAAKAEKLARLANPAASAEELLRIVKPTASAAELAQAGAPRLFSKEGALSAIEQATRGKVPEWLTNVIDGKRAALAHTPLAISDNVAAGRGAEFTQQLGSASKIDDLLGIEAQRGPAAIMQRQDELHAIEQVLSGAKADSAAGKLRYQAAKQTYKTAQQVKQEAGKSASSLFDEAALDVPAELQTPGLRNRFTEDAKTAASDSITNGPARGEVYKDFMARERETYGKLLNQQRDIEKAYRAAKADMPAPIKYGTDGVPLGKDKNLLRIGDTNVDFNAEMDRHAQGIPLTDPFMADAVGLVERGPVVPQGPLDSPHAIATVVDNVANATPLDPSIPKTATGRFFSLMQTALTEFKLAQGAANAAKGGLPSVGQIKSYWSGMQTETVRNLLMDPIYARFIAGHNGLLGAIITRNQNEAIDALAGSERNAAKLLGPIGDLRIMNGAKELQGTKELAAFAHNIGVNMHEVAQEGVDQMSSLQSALVGGAFGLATPGRAVTNLALMPLGALRPGFHAAFRVINSVIHNASRAAAFEQAYVPRIEQGAKLLLDAAEAEGKDVSRLRGLGFNAASDGTTIAKEGGFNPRQVTLYLGQRYGDEWQRIVKEADDAGFKRAREVFGDYSNRGKLETLASTVFPFMSWSWRAYPRVAYAALQHPAVVASILQLYQADAAQAKSEGRPGYQYGTLSIDKETPFLGILAKIFSPEQEAEVRFNPLALINPVGGESISAVANLGDSGGTDTRTGYQKFSDLAGLAGASPGPLPQTLAYISGQDYQAPSALSRYAPIDEAVDNAGIGFTEVPTIQGPLRAVRKAISGKSDNYDPIVAKAYELVMEDTGLPVSDSRNKAIAIGIASGNSPYLQRAERIVDVGGAGRAAFNANSPVSAQVTSQTTKDKRKSQMDTPYSYDEIQAVKAVDTHAAALMEQENQRYLLAHPAAAVSVKPTITPAQLASARGAALRAAGLR